jgi:hypothetical protein
LNRFLLSICLRANFCFSEAKTFVEAYFENSLKNNLLEEASIIAAYSPFAQLTSSSENIQCLRNDLVLKKFIEIHNSWLSKSTGILDKINLSQGGKNKESEKKKDKKKGKGKDKKIRKHRKHGKVDDSSSETTDTSSSSEDDEKNSKTEEFNAEVTLLKKSLTPSPLQFYFRAVLSLSNASCPSFRKFACLNEIESNYIIPPLLLLLTHYNSLFFDSVLPFNVSASSPAIQFIQLWLSSKIITPSEVLGDKILDSVEGLSSSLQIQQSSKSIISQCATIVFSFSKSHQRILENLVDNECSRDIEGKEIEKNPRFQNVIVYVLQVLKKEKEELKKSENSTPINFSITSSSFLQFLKKVLLISKEYGVDFALLLARTNNPYVINFGEEKEDSIIRKEGKQNSSEKDVSSGDDSSSSSSSDGERSQKKRKKSKKDSQKKGQDSKSKSIFVPLLNPLDIITLLFDLNYSKEGTSFTLSYLSSHSNSSYSTFSFQTKFLTLLIRSHPQIANQLLTKRKDIFSSFDKDLIALEAENVNFFFMFLIFFFFLGRFLHYSLQFLWK